MPNERTAQPATAAGGSGGGPAPATTPPHHLPAPLIPLVGRQLEVQQLLAHLADPAIRLVTLTGLGGIGKSRLAVEAAWQALADPACVHRFVDGIHLAPLTDLVHADQLPGALAAALEIQLEPAGEPLAGLISTLRSWRALLILDNLEHLAAEAERLTNLLQAAPGIVLLVTSRERLHLAGEQVLELDGLPLPNSADPAEGAQAPAVQLFLQTARAIQPGFEPGAAWPAILAICRQVHGLPLGLQLAATAVRVYSCQQLADSLRQNDDRLAATLRDVPPRHRSLRVVFEQSWALLTPSEQHALQQLAIFAGSFTDSAAAVLTGSTPTTLAALTDKSLLQIQRSSDEAELRRRIYPVLLPFVAEKLAAHPALAAGLRKQHCIYYCHLAAVQGQAIDSAAGEQATQQLRAELENIHRAWEWAANQRLLHPLAESIAGLAAYYLLRGPLADFEQQLNRVIIPIRTLADQVGATQQPALGLLARLLAALAQVQTERGAYAGAITTAQHALQAAQATHQLDSEGMAHLHWGRALFFLGQYEEAQKRLATALAIGLSSQTPSLTAAAHAGLGATRLYRGDYAAGQDHYEEALRLYQALGDVVNTLKMRYQMALTLFYAGDYLAAYAVFTACLQAAHSRQDQRTIGQLLNNLGAVHTQLGDYVQARHDYEAALSVKRSQGDRPYESLILANLGLLASHRRDHQAAVVLCREALQISQSLGERALTAYAQYCLGQALVGLGWLPEAADVFHEALQLRQELGQADQALEPLAGLAAVYLASEQPSQAQSYVEQILPRLATVTAAGIVEPFRIFWVCFQVLKANHDLRATDVLATAYAALQARAAKISDEASRRRYLEDISIHQQILSAYEQTPLERRSESGRQWRQRVEQHHDLAQDLERVLRPDDDR
jgi:predicted ATPase